MAGGLARGDIRLVRLAPPDKMRPAVVLTRDNMIPHLATVTIAPVTSAVRGVPSEVYLDESDGLKGPCAINLQNTVTVRQTLVGRWVATLGPERLAEVCRALRFALGCD
jgi:mRNA interferase MazF